MICLYSHTIKLFNFSTTFAYPVRIKKKNIGSVLFSVNRDCLKHLFHPHSDPFSPEAVRYREEMMRTPAALKCPSGASASHNEGISFIKKKSQNIMASGSVTLLGFLDISAL